jgi:hypothetical protein
MQVSFVETSQLVVSTNFTQTQEVRPHLLLNFSRDWRAKVCWISTAGIVLVVMELIQQEDIPPPSGCNVRIGNVFYTTQQLPRTANVLPNAILNPLRDTNPSGVINIDKASIDGNLNMNQPYSVNLSNVVVFDILLNRMPAITWSQVKCRSIKESGIDFGLLMNLNFAGGTITDSDFTSASLAASGRYVMSLTDIAGFTLQD